jgi:hypothetical protein
MDPTISNPGTTTGAGQAAEGQSLSPQTNVNPATQRANIDPNTNRGSTQEGASFSGPGGPGNQSTPGTQQQQQQRQPGYPGSNSS